MTINKGFSSTLNASRWIAALIVMIHHVRHIIFIDLKDVPNAGYVTKAFYFFSSLGHEAVIVFFVVSGLLVGALTLEKWRTFSKANIKDYFIHRFSRIYIVLIPALFIGFALDLTGAFYFNEAELYSNSEKYHTSSLNTVIIENLGINVLAGNLMMMQQIMVNVLGSNGPLWSLAYEWWYYCIWGFLIGSIYYKGLNRWIFIGLLGGLLIFLPSKILAWMLIWLLGIVVFYYGKSSLPRPHPIIGIILLLIVLGLSRLSVHYLDRYLFISSTYIDFIRDFLIGVAYSITLISCYKIKKPLWLDKMHAKIADFSYSLYLSHFPMMLLIVAIAQQTLGIEFLQKPYWKTNIYFVIIIILLYLYAYLFSLITEKHTYKCVIFLRSVFSKKFKYRSDLVLKESVGLENRNKK